MVQGRVTREMRNDMDRDFSSEEIYVAIKSMKPNSAPGPDGITTLFYQKYWPIVGKGFTTLALNILNGKENIYHLNNTFISLIPKTKKPKNTGELRPIALCNVLYKIISKTIANRLKGMLPNLIGPYQSAFVANRIITDNAMIAFEKFHFMKKAKGKKGFVGLKLDMSKAYDRLEWPFINKTLD